MLKLAITSETDAEPLRRTYMNQGVVFVEFNDGLGLLEDGTP